MKVHPQRKSEIEQKSIWEKNTHTQNERTEVTLTLIDSRFILGVALDVFGEPLIELFVGIEQRGHDEVQQGPQLRDGNDTLVNNWVQFTPTRTHS